MSELTEIIDSDAERAAALELARKNLRWGWALFGLFLLLFAGTIAVAYIYLWLS
jgi:hypothetical protein